GDEDDLCTECLFKEVLFGVAAKQLHRDVLVPFKPCVDNSSAELTRYRTHKTTPATVESVRHAQDASQTHDKRLILFFERLERQVLPFGNGLAVIPRHMGDQLPLAGRKTEQVGMANQVVGMLVVAAVADEVAGIVEDGRSLQKLAFSLFQTEGQRQRVEYGNRQMGHMAGVSFIHVAGMGELHDRILPGAWSRGLRHEPVPFHGTYDEPLADAAFIYHQPV